MVLTFMSVFYSQLGRRVRGFFVETQVQTYKTQYTTV